jgi:coenzyme F420-0:L-glutamate ligase/coenzyme F420-1:gamma-L-glutamate ligase
MIEGERQAGKGSVTASEIRVIPIKVAAPILPGEAANRSAGAFLAEAIAKNGVTIEDKDVLVVTSKVAALFEGRTVQLEEIKPSWKARVLGRAFCKDPRKVELLMHEGKIRLVVPFSRIVKKTRVLEQLSRLSPNPGVMTRVLEELNRYEFIVLKHGAILDEAGIDFQNAPRGYVTLLPPDPCQTAWSIREELKAHFGKEVAVLISDTVSLIGRTASQNIAIGFSGLDPVTREYFKRDLFGKFHSGGAQSTIDSLTACAGLLMGQTTELTPVALIRGYGYSPEQEDAGWHGMQEVAYPPGVIARSVFWIILATLWFYLVNLVTFQRWPKACD